MANMGRNISLTPQQIAFVDQQVANGRHASGSEVVREALRRYQDDIAREQSHLDYLRRLGSEGEAAYARGDFTTLDSPEAVRDFVRQRGRRGNERVKRGRA
jgi:antitoxin ParD1/3/4